MSDEHEKYVEKVTGLAVEVGWKGAAALAGPKGWLVGLARSAPGLFWTTGTERLQAAVQEQIADAALRRLPDVERRVEELHRRGVNVSPSDFARVLMDFAKATQNCADEKKRKVLEDAFVNAFEPELYQAGLLSVLWQKLDKLSYGDLRLLGEIAAGGENANTVIGNNEIKTKSTLKSFHYATLADETLVASNVPEGGNKVYATELGRMMTKLCAEPSTPPAPR